ncbi:RagB/SusD family nutrient uptake outer membrane protein [Chitinophaga cymbidii]|uniref:Membrane protein n=1 Tax=Chitinophaga cymbidii TaxID=1096750 RepID=A0A512RPA4_9BACT|nr:RagB/SusD family nutrient uptake outer membrane protein [Chitinophaga cymbidii]GEP97532.1 membrane protein [Chitinophaga cymbidii]
MKLSITILLFASMLLGSCSKYINEPDHSVLPTDILVRSMRDLDNLLYGAYGALANDNTLAGNWKIFPEIMADQVVLNVDGQTADDPYVELYNRNMAAAQYPGNWQQAYTAIQNVNTVLYAIDNNMITKEKDPEFSDGARNRIKGEALFIRGLVNFELLRLYGHQYGHNSSAAQSGIVLRTKPVINVTKPEEILGQRRATVEECYTQVINDLKEAESLLPVEPLRRGRATVHAAASYLARVYFQMNDYPNALIQINKVIGPTAGTIETGFKLVRSPAYGKLTTAQAQANVLAAFNATGTGTKVSEIIFDMISVTGAASNGAVSRKYLRSSSIEPQFAISSTFLAEAAFASSDARLSRLITKANGKSYTRKFDRSLLNVPIIRSAELVLDRAEILALQGNTEDAAKDINYIRYRAIPNYDSATVIAPADILEEVRRERIRELCFEGDRLHDLRRRQADIGAGDRTGGVLPLPWNSNGLLFKIPDAEIKASNGMQQNED